MADILEFKQPAPSASGNWRDRLPSNQCFQCGECAGQEFLLLSLGQVYCSACGTCAVDLFVGRMRVRTGEGPTRGS